MRVKFKAPREIDGVPYTKGTHEVPDKLKGHWFFKAMLLNGIVSVVGESEKPKAAAKPVEPPKAPSYHEHMASWESKEEQGKQEIATQEQTEAMVESGEAEIPAEAVLDIKALRKQAKELGLKAGGSAKDLAERISEHLSKQGGDQAAE